MRSFLCCWFVEVNSGWWSPSDFLEWGFCGVRFEDGGWPAEVLSVDWLSGMIGVGELQVELVGSDGCCGDGRLLKYRLFGWSVCGLVGSCEVDDW